MGGAVLGGAAGAEVTGDDVRVAAAGGAVVAELLAPPDPHAPTPKSKAVIATAILISALVMLP